MELFQRSNEKEIIRQSAGFHPSVWNDFFISIPPSVPPSKMESFKLKCDKLKVKVRKMFIDINDPMHLMELIDRIQCFGLAYHFEKEIEEKLLHIHNSCVSYDDIHSISLYFRLLRQQRYFISSDVFNQFLDKNGEFISLNSNVKALLSFYDAIHLYMPGEDVLDRALKFSKFHLKSLPHNLDPYLSIVVSSNLEVPLVRKPDRLKAKLYLSAIGNDDASNDILVHFAKLDFNLLQSIHQDEARILTIWWENLELMEILRFTRDRLLECYFWALSTYFEPHYSRARIMMSKALSLVSILDDIYDVYGNIEELELLTNIIDRWELKSIEMLPQYLQRFFLSTYNTFKEFEDELKQQQYSFRVQYLKLEMKRLSKAYFQEAMWANNDYVPNLKEYLNVSLISSTYALTPCASYIGMDEELSKDFFDSITTLPQIIKSSCIIGRVMNDIASNEFEQKRKHVASSVQCYIMEHGCSVDEASKKLKNLVEEEWKILNKEFMFSKIPISLLRNIINLTNIIEVAYINDKDTYTISNEIMKDNITKILVKPFYINGD